MPILQSLTPWTDPAERFYRFGAKNLKNMSPKMRPVKTCSEKDVPQPDSRKKFYHENTKKILNVS